MLATVKQKPSGHVASRQQQGPPDWTNCKDMEPIAVGEAAEPPSRLPDTPRVSGTGLAPKTPSNRSAFVPAFFMGEPQNDIPARTKADAAAPPAPGDRSDLAPAQTGRAPEGRNR